MAEPTQLPLFPDQAALARHWGRIGNPGRIRLEPHPDPGAAINALVRLTRRKRRRGCRHCRMTQRHAA
jgi:predicted DNA-binding WGR domain protein